MARYSRNEETIEIRSTKRPGRPPNVVFKNLQPIVRQFIRTENLNGQYVSIERLRKYIASKHKVSIPKTNLWRALNRWGFTHGEGRRRNALKEQDYVILARRKYLRAKLANRNTDGTLKSPEVYLDETYINRNHSNRFTWYLEEDGDWVNKPSGVGPRLIVVHAITKDGWVNPAELVFDAKKRTGDYHGQMNWDNFSRWFRLQLLDNIPKRSIVILDNAKYHNVLANDGFPGKSATKEKLRTWLSMNGYPWREDMLKSELLELCMRLAPAPEFRLDQIAAEKDISILRTPQYHPELQPIETCWAIVKNYMANNCDFTMSGLRSNLPKAFEKVTANTCKKIIAKVAEQENRYWTEDQILDEQYDSDFNGKVTSQYSEKENTVEHYLDEI
jgi:transposase